MDRFDFAGFVRDAEKAVVSGPGSSAWQQLYPRLASHTVVVAGSGDRHAISRLRANVDRLRHRIEHHLGPSADEVVELADLTAALGDVLLATDQEVVRRRDDASLRALHSRVLDRLVDGRPARPRDLAVELGADPGQLSRTLSDLVAAGQIELVDQPAASDGRARWYRLVPQHVEVHEARDDLAVLAARATLMLVNVAGTTHLWGVGDAARSEREAAIQALSSAS